jgi:two-component system nitrogen regulation sensor histidine kinase NtrY
VPKPVIEIQDLRESVQEPVVLFREGHPGVSYNLDVPAAPIVAAFDRRLITQAVTNLVKNATEAVEQRAETQGKAFKPRVDVVLGSTPSELIIDVIDNGVGLPKQNRSRLLEPYVTTKGSKGTGLGLAIVQKITEQHGGTLTLEDAPPRDGANGPETGARVRLSLPRRTELPASQAVDKVTGEAAAQSAAV